MYDIETMRRLNEEACRFAMSLSNTNEAPAVNVKAMNAGLGPTPVFPLSILAGKLRAGPPSIAYFVQLLEMSDYFLDFRKLIRDYLPKHEMEIMAEDIDKRVQMFSLFFTQEYFPLNEEALSGELDIGQFVSGIPFQPMGFSSEGYHNFQGFRPGYILALSLVDPRHTYCRDNLSVSTLTQCPWDEDPYGDDFGEDVVEDKDGVPGIRIPILETVRDMIGARLANLIPGKGFTPQEIHDKTDGTEFDGLGQFADWVSVNSDNALLDTMGESLYLEGGPPWDSETVEGMTVDWEEATDIISQIHNIALLLEKDPKETFQRLLALLLDNNDLIIPKEQLPLSM